MADERDPLGILGKTLEEKYRIESLAGMGGFSAVYRAQHVVWNEPVAIKFFTLLQDADASLREKLLEDFIQEGKLMSQLSSRSAAIVQARDMGKLRVEEDGEWIPYMVLEWLDGLPLDQVISRERKAGLILRSLSEAVSLLEPAAIALDIAHRGNVAHRDLKPANLVITGDPRDPEAGLKVLDFGIAKVMEAQIELKEQLQLTGQHVTAFTPNYGAPEQFSRNFGATGPWSDVFSMALIVLELLQGTRVLEGETFFELGVASCDEQRRPTPRALGVEVSDEVEAVFAKALAVNPKQRYPNMGAFWRALHQAAFPGTDTWSPRTDKPSLRNLQNPLSTGERPPIIITPADPRTVGGSHPDTISAMSFAEMRSRRRKPILWAAGAVAIASIAVLVLAISSRRTQAVTPAAANESVAASPSAPTGSSPTSPPSEAAPEPAPAPSPSAVPKSSAVPTASAAPSTEVAAPQPNTRVVPVPPGPKTPPNPPPAGGDPWDPGSFGGRR